MLFCPSIVQPLDIFCRRHQMTDHRLIAVQSWKHNRVFSDPHLPDSRIYAWFVRGRKTLFVVSAQCVMHKASALRIRTLQTRDKRIRSMTRCHTTRSRQTSVHNKPVERIAIQQLTKHWAWRNARAIEYSIQLRTGTDK